MGQPELENKTPFTFEPLFLTDEDARPLLVLVIKATYTLGPGELELAEEQVPVCVEGEYWGRPEESSYRFEPECAPFKPATDVVLVGHAYAPKPGTRELLAELQAGPLRKVVRVVGDRIWFKSLGTVSMTKPLPFERMPLVYERAFGGWDRGDPDPTRHTFEPRNPVGTGFRAGSRHFVEGLRLPNLEDPQNQLERFGQVVPPAGFGFLSPHWQPRAALAGTYDETWRKQRMPRLPKDFDRRFYNAASPGLVAPGYLQGGESVTLVHVTLGGRLSFRLPVQPIPQVTVELAGSQDLHIPLHLDTLVIDTDSKRVLLLWRGSLPLPGGYGDVRTLSVSVHP
jgi:hypothetical protein